MKAKRNNVTEPERGSSSISMKMKTSKKINKDIVRKALQKFRKRMESSSSVFQRESWSESRIKDFAELKKKKIVDKVMPLVLKNSSGPEVYGIVTELEAGFHQAIEDIMKPFQGVDRIELKFRDQQKFKRLRWLVLTVLDKLKNMHGGLVPIRRKWYPDYKVALELRVEMAYVRKVLQKNAEFSKRKYRKTHAKLVRIIRMAQQVLANVRERKLKTSTEDTLMWRWALYLDIGGCLSSALDPEKFKQDRREYLQRFVDELVDAELINDPGNLNVDSLSENDTLGYWLRKLDKKMKATPGPYDHLVMDETNYPCELFMGKLCYFWSMRALKECSSWAMGRGLLRP